MTLHKKIALGALALNIALFGTYIQAQEKTKVRVGYFSQLHDAAVLNLKQDLADKYEFEYIKFQRYADAAIALSRGDLDVSSLGYANLITEAAKNIEPKFKFISGLARGAINLVCNNSIKVDNWADLKGKNIGIVAGFPEIFLDDALQSHKQNPADVKKINFAVAGPPVLQALKDGTTDCSAVFEPFGATAVSNGYAYYPNTNLAENSFKGLNNGIAANVDFVSKNTDIITDIVASVKKSTSNFKEQPEQWIELMTKSQDFPKAIVEIGVKRVVLDAELYPKEAAILANNMKELGLIRTEPSEEHLNNFFSK
ncbi:ABC transporter substrate-binding protein [Advenella sp. RU8]|uniref:ABC transporter substrate-binding protein n=1 Tax=Advenella sp. RU8 TaxID=3399575 RepID=UPI003AAE43A5